MHEHDDMLADLLLVAKSIYRRRDIIRLDKETQAEAARRLNAYGILSLQAISAILETSRYRVKAALKGQVQPVHRGHLNPAHLNMLAFSLSLGSLPGRWIEEMTENGTSVSTIHTLTGVPESTIYRRKGTTDE